LHFIFHFPQFFSPRDNAPHPEQPLWVVPQMDRRSPSERSKFGETPENLPILAVASRVLKTSCELPEQNKTWPRAVARGLRSAPAGPLELALARHREGVLTLTWARMKTSNDNHSIENEIAIHCVTQLNGFVRLEVLRRIFPQANECVLKHVCASVNARKAITNH
jgi:hypothetical protein